MKKVLAFVLALIMVLTAVPFAYAADGSVKSETETVARLYIWVRIRVFGHSGIYVENTTNHDIKVGCYTCPAGQGVTVSEANLSRSDGKGNYYNIDAYMLNQKGKSNTVAAGMDLTQAQLDTVSRSILGRNTYQTVNNCDYFACMVWNSVASHTIKFTPSPLVLKGRIKKCVDNTSVPNFYNPSREQCFKQQGVDGGAYLTPCSDGSYKKAVG